MSIGILSIQLQVNLRNEFPVARHVNIFHLLTFIRVPHLLQIQTLAGLFESKPCFNGIHSKFRIRFINRQFPRQVGCNYLHQAMTSKILSSASRIITHTVSLGCESWRKDKYQTRLSLQKKDSLKYSNRLEKVPTVEEQYILNLPSEWINQMT